MAGEPMDVDQSSLTGESLPVTKFEGESVYAGSIIKKGELDARVTATGGRTFFGKAAMMVDVSGGWCVCVCGFVVVEV